MHKRRQQGFTLIELIVTVAVLVILATIAWSVYQSQMRKQYRSDAVIALTKAAQREERLYTDNGSYTNNIANIGGSTTPQDHYTLSLSIPNSAGCKGTKAGSTTYFCYRLTATAKGSQQADTKCYKFILDHTGKKSSEDKSGNPSKGCWSK